MTDLAELLERVRKAEGRDRNLDAHIAGAIAPWADTSICNGRTLPQAIEWRPDAPDLARAYDVGDYTSSLDACLVLLGEVLPGWHWRLSHDGATHRRTYFAQLSIPYGMTAAYAGRGYPEGFSDGASPALAMLAATLQALIAQQEKKAEASIEKDRTK